MNPEPSLLILCANLVRRKDRRFVMTNTLWEVLGLPVQFLDAVDGEWVPKWKLARYPADVTPSSYAVRLTKRLALRRFLQSSSHFLLYLEDDVVVTEEFDQRVQEAMSLGKEVVFLGGGHILPPLGEGRWQQSRRTYNNHALLFSREGARKCRRVLSQWKQGWSDSEIQQATEEGRLEVWCANPWVAFQRESQADNWGNFDCVGIAEAGTPMMLPDDLAVLDAALNISKVVIEYGSGGSTLHVGSRLKDWGRLVSVEHSREWYEKVKPELDRLGLPVDYLLREPRPLRSGDGPWRFLPGQLDDYVEAPAALVAEGEADLLFIDGRERIRCALASARLLRPGGLMMIHDFWPRARYRASLAELLDPYDFLFDTPGRKGDDPQGMAVFRKKLAGSLH